MKFNNYINNNNNNNNNNFVSLIGTDIKKMY